MSMYELDFLRPDHVYEEELTQTEPDETQTKK